MVEQIDLEALQVRKQQLEKEALAIDAQFARDLQQHYGKDFEHYNAKENLVTNEQKAERLNDRANLLRRFTEEEQGNISAVYKHSIEVYASTLDKQADAVRRGDMEEFRRLENSPEMQEARKHMNLNNPEEFKHFAEWIKKEGNPLDYYKDVDKIIASADQKIANNKEQEKLEQQKKEATQKTAQRNMPEDDLLQHAIKGLKTLSQKAEHIEYDQLFTFNAPAHGNEKGTGIDRKGNIVS